MSTAPLPAHPGPTTGAGPVRNRDKGLPGNGGRFAPDEKGDSGVALAPPGVTFPDTTALSHEYPNPFQRLDHLNVAYYAVAWNPLATTTEQERAARDAVREVIATRGRFVSLPEDDGLSEQYVRDALRSGDKVLAAIDQVGSLPPHDQRTFGDRIAGALHDIEALAREERIAQTAWVTGLPDWDETGVGTGPTPQD